MMRRSARGSTVLRVSALALAGSAMLAAPSPAQIARARVASADAPKMLVVPFQREQPDSVLSVTLADGLRSRVQNAYLTRFNPILKEGMNRALTESGFPVDMPLEPGVVRQLARFLNARLQVEGNILRRPGDSVLIIARLSETAGASPQSATAILTVPRVRATGGTGGTLANQLAEAHRSFEDVQQCRQRLEAGQFVEAVREAESALRRYPNSSSALLCLVAVLRRQSAGADTIVATLRRAEAVDSLNTTVRRQLAAIYQERGDTNGLIDQIRKILQVDRADNDLRIRLARLYVQIGGQGGDSARAQLYADSAVAIVDSGLATNPANIELLTTRSIALGAARRWAPAAEALTLVASADSQRIDSLFLVRITNYYQAAPDSANLYLWTRIATQRMPAEPLYWYSLSTMALSRADTALALESGRQYLVLRPSDGRGHLLVARVFFGLGAIDSMVAHATAAAADSALRPFTSGFFLQAGARSMRDSNWTQAAERLQVATDYAVGRAKATPAFYLGSIQLQLAVAADTDANANRNCESVRRAQDMLTRAEQNIILGAAQDRGRANEFLSNVIPGFRQRAEAMARNFQCP